MQPGAPHRDDPSTNLIEAGTNAAGTFDADKGVSLSISSQLLDLKTFLPTHFSAGEMTWSIALQDKPTHAYKGKL